jgi:hypothetical protein
MTPRALGGKQGKLWPRHHSRTSGRTQYASRRIVQQFIRCVPAGTYIFSDVTQVPGIDRITLDYRTGGCVGGDEAGGLRSRSRWVI